MTEIQTGTERTAESGAKAADSTRKEPACAAEIYKDIIGLPRHVSRRHRPMPLEDRAAQFAAFDALKEAAKPDSKLNRAASAEEPD